MPTDRLTELVADCQRLAQGLPDSAYDLELAVTSLINLIEREDDEPFDSALNRAETAIEGPDVYMTREEDQLQRESDERAAFNDRLDQHFYER